MHTRILSLESAVPQPDTHLDSVADIQVIGKYKGRLITQCNDCKLNITSPQGANSRFASMTGLSKKPSINMKVWQNTMSKKKTLVSINILKELTFREISYGEECPTSICMVEMETERPSMSGTITEKVKVLGKFRQVVPNHDKMTQEEGQHMVNTSMDEDIADLFPKLYFIGTVTTTKGGVWEVVGTELMEELYDFQLKNSHEPYYSAFKLLKMLHEAGYVHGDPHIGNFMRIPIKSLHPVIDSNRVIMIDQDSMRTLPTDAKDGLIAKLMIMHDLYTLLTWNNRHCLFFHMIKSHLHEQITMYLYEVNEGLSLLTPPYRYNLIRFNSLNKFKKYISRPEFKEFNSFLQGAKLEEIYSEFERIFSSKENMMNINDDFWKYVKENKTIKKARNLPP